MLFGILSNVNKNIQTKEKIMLSRKEFLKLSGKEEEANSHLKSPIVRNDSFAQYLLRNMKIKVVCLKGELPRKNN